MKIHRTTLLQTLKALMAGVAENSLVQQSDCFIFREQGIQTYNEEIACFAPSPTAEIQGAVKAGPLLGLLNRLSERELDFEVTDNELIVKGKNKRAGIPFESEIFLPIDTVERVEKWDVLRDDFLDGLSKVDGYAGRDQSQFALTCVHLTPTYVETTDSFQAARYKVGVPLQSKQALIKQDVIKVLVAAEVAWLAETGAWLHFRNKAEVVISCRKYQTEYPSLNDFLKFEGGKLVLPDGLVNTVQKAELFSAENPDANVIMVQLKPGRILLEGRGLSGWYQETKELDYDGPAIRFLIKPSIINSLLSHSAECRLAADRLVVEVGKFSCSSCLGVE